MVIDIHKAPKVTIDSLTTKKTIRSLLQTWNVIFAEWLFFFEKKIEFYLERIFNYLLIFIKINYMCRHRTWLRNSISWKMQ